MDDREAQEAGRASEEARHAVPSYAPQPAEEFRQDLMVRYLQAMTSSSATAATAEPDTGHVAASTPAPAAARATTPADLQVRHVMRRAVTAVTADTPFLDIARMLARRRIGAAPVVDDSQRVIGVIAESDLLARAASLASSGERPGPFAKLLGRRQPAAESGGTAATLMSAPALTVHPWTPVVDAARTAARSRVRQIFVTDPRGGLVGVVSRNDLLHALVRDDAAIREEVVGHVLRDELGLPPGSVDVRVLNGTVTLTGRLDSELVPRLTEAVAGIADVVEVVDRLTVV
ncbi:CBS domain-containing protein [Streptomyces sp. NPDC006997]|uniref:CBS domain-containing protein n=1 Tax=Streptomyces sp. NPDC006997 TaxID=3155356 RepID=UPI00340B301E